MMVQSRGSVKQFKQNDALVNNDVMLCIAPFLDSRELFSLALTCKRMGAKSEDDDWSLVEEVARQLIGNLPQEERNALRRYEGESWLSVLHEAELLRCPLTFDQLVGDRVEYVHGDKACITSTNPMYHRSDVFNDIWTGYMCTAISNHVMRSGKHYAKFTMKGFYGFNYYWPGIMRPVKHLDEFGFTEFNLYGNWPIERNHRWGESTVNWCTFYSFDGDCSWGDWDSTTELEAGWDGKEGFENNADDGELGLLLDLDEGTLTAYKNGVRLGVMKDVSLYAASFLSSIQYFASIQIHI